MGEANFYYFTCLKIKKKKNFKNGSHARSRKGYFSKRSALQAFTSDLAEAEFRGCQGSDLQVGQEGSHSFSNRRHFEGFSRSRSGEICDWNQSPPHSEGERLGL